VAPFPKKHLSSIAERRTKRDTESAKTSCVKKLDRQSIEAKALGYLDKFDASASRLRRILSDFVKRRARELGVDPLPHLQTVNETLERYQRSGLLDDRRYGVAMARSLAERGASRQAIKAKLYGRGISAQVVDEIICELGTQGASELSAARALVRKRKIGKYRAENEWHANYRRDLSVLARAGFDFDTAKRALSLQGADEEEGF
jgi:regulatory protein